MELRSHVNINMFILYLMFWVLFNIHPLQHPDEDYVCIFIFQYCKEAFSILLCSNLCIASSFVCPACPWPSQCSFIVIPMSSLLYLQLYYLHFYCFYFQILCNIWFWILSFVILFLTLLRDYIIAACVCFRTHPDFLKH
jgi:hypothetical protein